MQRSPVSQNVPLGLHKASRALGSPHKGKVVLRDPAHCVSSALAGCSLLNRRVPTGRGRAENASGFPSSLLRCPWSMPADRDKPLPTRYAIFDDIRGGVLLAADAETAYSGVPERIARL
jgi:hypothetical protein